MPCMSTDPETLARFRAAIANLDPTRPPDGSDEQAWYVSRPDGAEQELIARLTLEPTCHCAIVGPIGSGKSSALKAMERALAGTPGILTLYIEVSRLTDLSKASEISVAVAIGRAAAEGLGSLHPANATLRRLRNTWRNLAEGYRVDPWEDWGPEEDPEPGRWVDGVETPKTAPYDGALIEPWGDLATAAATVAMAHVVLLVDGLDRVPSAQRFEELVSPLLASLRAAKIGGVLVSPWRSVLGADRIESDRRFDEIAELGPILADSGDVNLAFFDRVLRARAVRDLFSKEALAQLAHSSGGLLRDFVQLSKQALTYAWSDGARAADAGDARRAADRLGRGRLLGLTDDDITALEKVNMTGHFAARTPEQQALVITGRIIQSNGPGGALRTWVHPTLVPFLPQALNTHSTANTGR